MDVTERTSTQSPGFRSSPVDGSTTAGCFRGFPGLILSGTLTSMLAGMKTRELTRSEGFSEGFSLRQGGLSSLRASGQGVVCGSVAKSSLSLMAHSVAQGVGFAADGVGDEGGVVGAVDATDVRREEEAEEATSAHEVKVAIFVKMARMMRGW